MRVLHFVGYFPPEKVGGVGEFVKGLHEALVSAGHTSTVVTSGRRSQEGVHRISRTPLGWFLKSALWARRAHQYDVIHCQAGEAVLLVLVLRLRRLLGVDRKSPKILSTFHVHYSGMAASFKPYSFGGVTFARDLRSLRYRTLVSWAHRIVDAITLRLSDAVHTISLQSARDVLGEERGRNALVVYYGLAELGPETQPEHEIESCELLYAGTCGHRKRVAILPFVLERIRREVPDARLRILGFLPEREPKVVQLFEDRGLMPFVDFAGVKASEELSPYYARADVLLVPSAYEGLPFVILEAMRSGLPVVATRVSGHPEAIIDGENGFLVDLDAPDQMAERCIRILKDRTLREDLGAAGRETIRERFALATQMAEYLALYERVVSGS